jgi:hypothetical protein
MKIAICLTLALAGSAALARPGFAAEEPPAKSDGASAIVKAQKAEGKETPGPVSPGGARQRLQAKKDADTKDEKKADPREELYSGLAFRSIGPAITRAGWSTSRSTPPIRRGSSSPRRRAGSGAPRTPA